jgi:biotin transport system substrate-specific component
MLWLAFFAQLASGAVGVGLSRAYAAGVAPFIVGSLVKTALAVALVAAGWRLALSRR